MFDQYIPVEKIASMLNVSKQTVYKYIREGEFPSVRKAASLGFPGNTGYEVQRYDVVDFMRRREEAKAAKKTRKTKKIDEETKQLLTELHTNMVRQAEIIGKLLEKL
jgi:excisionase family DNA binding protein